MGKTNIEWTGDVWQVTSGCEHVSPGCAHCYAARTASGRLRNHPRYKGLTDKNGNWTREIRLNYDQVEVPLHWRTPRMVFVNSMSDLFHPKVPSGFQVRVFNTIRQCPQHTFQVLTKHPDEMADFSETIDWPPNAWALGSTENQEWADKRVPHILRVRGAIVRGVSMEPLLGPIDINRDYNDGRFWGDMLHWGILGGESGPRRRPVDLQWMRDIRDQFKAAGVPLFVKQIDKVQPIPEDLMIREFPRTPSGDTKEG